MFRNLFVPNAVNKGINSFPQVAHAQLHSLARSFHVRYVGSVDSVRHLPLQGAVSCVTLLTIHNVPHLVVIQDRNLLVTTAYCAELHRVLNSYGHHFSPDMKIATDVRLQPINTRIDAISKRFHDGSLLASIASCIEVQFIKEAKANNIGKGDNQ